MRKLLLLLVLLPTIAVCQTQKDYEKQMARFMKFYNNSQGDSIKNMWPPEERDMDDMWSADQLKDLHERCGNLMSFKYIGIDKADPSPRLAVFRTKFSKVGEKVTSFTLEKGFLGTFRFITTSPGIEKMLKESK